VRRLCAKSLWPTAASKTVLRVGGFSLLASQLPMYIYSRCLWSASFELVPCTAASFKLALLDAGRILPISKNFDPEAGLFYRFSNSSSVPCHVGQLLLNRFLLVSNSCSFSSLLSTTSATRRALSITRP